MRIRGSATPLRSPFQVSVECTPRGDGCGIRAPQADSSSRTQDAEHVNGPQNERDPPACIDDMGLGPQGLLAP